MQEELEPAAAVDGRVLERGRLLTNLLSSQPLAFNLFAELDQHPRLAGRALQLVLPDLVGTVNKICFEWSSGRKAATDAYLANNSTFDVAVDADGPAGKVLLGIEVKYHENLQAKAVDIGPRVREVAIQAGMDPDEPALSTAPLNQLFLDYVLACSVAQVEDRAACFVVLLAGPEPALPGRRRGLPPGSPAADSFRAITLEELVGAIAGCSDAAWPRVFRRRYLESDRVSHLTHVAHGARGRNIRRDKSRIPTDEHAMPPPT